MVVVDFLKKMALWYYGENGQQIGPLEDHAIREAVREGKVGAETLVWREGMAVWQPLSQVSELSTPYASPQVYHSYPTGMVRTSGLAITSLVCGIVGLLTCLVLAGIPAVICGHMALNQIGQDPTRIGGRGMAIAGLIMGYLQLLCCVAALVLFFTLGFAGLSNL